MKYSKEEKAMWVEDWRQSGKSATAYARQNGLIPWTFIKWTKEQGISGGGFMEVPVPLKLSEAVPQIVIEKGYVKIYIPATLNAAQMQNVMEGLRKTL